MAYLHIQLVDHEFWPVTQQIWVAEKLSQVLKDLSREEDRPESWIDYQQRMVEVDIPEQIIDLISKERSRGSYNTLDYFLNVLENQEKFLERERCQMAGRVLRAN